MVLISPTPSLVTTGRVPPKYNTYLITPPPPAVELDLELQSASIPLVVSQGPSKSREDNQPTRGSRKRRPSAGSATAILMNKHSKLIRRAKTNQDSSKPCPNSADPGTSPSTKTDNSIAAAPVGKGKGRMTRSATAAAARVSQDTSETDKPQTGGSVRQQCSRGLWAAILSPWDVDENSSRIYKRNQLGEVSPQRFGPQLLFSFPDADGRCRKLMAVTVSGAW